MKQIIIEPAKSVNKIPFGSSREMVRKEFGKKYKEIKKTIFAKNTMDAYDDFHVFYTEDNKFDAIEIFGRIKVIIDGKVVFPGKVSEIYSILDNPKCDKTWITSENMAIGVTTDLDDSEKISDVIFGSKSYFVS